MKEFRDLMQKPFQKITGKTPPPPKRIESLRNVVPKQLQLCPSPPEYKKSLGELVPKQLQLRQSSLEHEKYLRELVDGTLSPKQKDTQYTIYKIVAEKFVLVLKSIDSENIAYVVENNIEGDLYTNIAKDIERLDLQDVSRENLTDFVKALEYMLINGIDGDFNTPNFNTTYETIRNYSKTKRHTFQKKLDYLISIPTENNLITAVEELEKKFNEPEWLIELTFLMECREKINTFIKESGFRDIESIGLPPILKEYLQYKSGVRDSGPLFVAPAPALALLNKPTPLIDVMLKHDGTFYWLIFENQSDEALALEVLRNFVVNNSNSNFKMSLYYLIDDDRLKTRKENYGRKDQPFSLPLTLSPLDYWWLKEVLGAKFNLDFDQLPDNLVDKGVFQKPPPEEKPPKDYDSDFDEYLSEGSESNEGESDPELNYRNAHFVPNDKLGKDPVTFVPENNTIIVQKQKIKDKSGERDRASVRPEVTQTKDEFRLKYPREKGRIRNFKTHDDGTYTFTLITEDQKEEEITMTLGYLKANHGLSRTNMGIQLENPACGQPQFIRDTDSDKEIEQRFRKPVIYFYNFNSNRVISTSVVVDKKLIIDELIPEFNHVININEASSMVLATLPCIGRRLAERMVASRPKGGYSSVTDLLQIEGIGKKTFATIKPFISIDKIPNHWIVKQSPKNDGSVIDIKDNNAEYPYLYWDANAPHGVFTLNVDQSFCVKKDVLTSFLTEKLAVLGLNKKESADFIEFWVPLLTGDSFKMYPYVMVEFMEENYTDLAALHIHPQPDQVIRVFANFQLSAEPIICGEPELTPVTRMDHGRVVVEWGGTERVPGSMPNIGTSVKAPHYAMHAG